MILPYARNETRVHVPKRWSLLICCGQAIQWL